MTLSTLRRILDETDRGPTPDQLATAPLLQGWWIVDLFGGLRAQGDLTGHPEIDDPWVLTSPLVMIDTDAGWLRSRSRFYRIGPMLELGRFEIVDAVPLDQAQAELAQIRTLLRAKVQQAGHYSHGGDNEQTD